MAKVVKKMPSLYVDDHHETIDTTSNENGLMIYINNKDFILFLRKKGL